MDRKILKQLAGASFRRNKLDSERVRFISKKLKRSDLKTYIRYLKRADEENTVRIFISSDSKSLEREIRKMFEKIYPNKEIEIGEDESLIAGIKILDGDIVYELNLRDVFNKALTHLSAEL